MAILKRRNRFLARIALALGLAGAAAGGAMTAKAIQDRRAAPTDIDTSRSFREPAQKGKEVLKSLEEQERLAKADKATREKQEIETQIEEARKLILPAMAQTGVLDALSEQVEDKYAETERILDSKRISDDIKIDQLKSLDKEFARLEKEAKELRDVLDKALELLASAQRRIKGLKDSRFSGSVEGEGNIKVLLADATKTKSEIAGKTKGKGGSTGIWNRVISYRRKIAEAITQIKSRIADQEYAKFSIEK